MTVSPRAAAKYLWRLSDGSISNLALHKMLYLADMNYTGRFHSRLLSEPFEAWDYGPVIPSLYHACKAFGAKPIGNIFWGDPEIAGTPEANVLDEAWANLRYQSPGQLVQNTHWSRGAWAGAYIPGARGRKITDAAMIDEYRRRIEGHREPAGDVPAAG